MENDTALAARLARDHQLETRDVAILFGLIELMRDVAEDIYIVRSTLRLIYQDDAPRLPRVIAALLDTLRIDAIR